MEVARALDTLGKAFVVRNLAFPPDVHPCAQGLLPFVVRKDESFPSPLIWGTFPSCPECFLASPSPECWHLAEAVCGFWPAASLKVTDKGRLGSEGQ